MHFVDLLTMSFMAIGLVIGTAVGVGAALALRWLFPGYQLQALQVLLVSAGLLVGAFVGSRFDLEKGRKP